MAVVGTSNDFSLTRCPTAHSGARAGRWSGIHRAPPIRADSRARSCQAKNAGATPSARAIIASNALATFASAGGEDDRWQSDLGGAHKRGGLSILPGRALCGAR